MFKTPTSLGSYEYDSIDGQAVHSTDLTTTCSSTSPAFEIVIDSFAGGGGASTGIEMALRSMKASGVPMDSADVTVAINHDGAALAMHTANHPGTIHMEADIWTVDPLRTTNGLPVGLFWASPDCTHFSRAKGGAPISNARRGLGMVVVHWAEQVQPRLIFLENVEEYQDWGPLMKGPKGKLVPNPMRKGKTFKIWVAKFRKLGYRVEWKLLRACDYGAPTIRKRLYVIMRRDGEAIVWPKPTHSDPKSLGVREGKRLPWRTAAEIIDWSLPCHSIFMNRTEADEYRKATGYSVKRPLVDNTMARIAAGVKRHVIDNATPFIVTCNHGGPGFRGQGLDDPFVTVAGSRDAHGLVMPVVTTYYGERGDGIHDRASTMESPLPTVTTANRHGVVYAFLTSHHSHDPHGVPVDVPLRAITGKPKTDPVVVTPMLPPLNAVQTAKAHEVAEFLRDHGAWNGGEFVTIGDYIVVDIGMRMLTPQELAKAQGFPEDYILAAPYRGGTISPSEQRHKIGNSVCPPVAKALVEANYTPQTSQPFRSKQGWLFEEAA